MEDADIRDRYDGLRWLIDAFAETEAEHRQLEFHTDRHPGDATLRLMATLGVKVVVADGAAPARRGGRGRHRR